MQRTHFVVVCCGVLTMTTDHLILNSNILDQLKEAIKTKRRGKLTKGIFFLQDNAPAHTSNVVAAKLNTLGFQLVHHPPYSPDLAPSDYYLWFTAQQKDFYLNGLEKLQLRFTKCISLRGEYVE
uniref:Tc1-like transposase DDE domain-containing protein n=1 Tax=Paramormyrops kingsleyae TaxID=1676925 RepID=A0A3B3R7J2_9TELE